MLALSLKQFQKGRLHLQNHELCILGELNLGKIQKLIDSNKIDPKKIINYKTLLDLGLMKSNKTRIKLLAKGEIKNKIDIEVSAFSNSAKEIIEKAGGSIIVLDNKTIDKKAKKSED